MTYSSELNPFFFPDLSEVFVLGRRLRLDAESGLDEDDFPWLPTKEILYYRNTTQYHKISI